MQKYGIYFLVLVFLTIALRPPGFLFKDADAVLKGHDLVLVLDMSQSMSAEDIVVDGMVPLIPNPSPSRGEGDKQLPGMLGNRFQVAKKIVDSYIQNTQQRVGDRVGVILFAGKANLLCPLTADMNILQKKIASLDIAFPPVGIYPDEADWQSGTRIGQAIELAIENLNSEFRGSQSILLISDGDDPLEGNDIPNALSQSKSANIPIHTICLGDHERGTPILEGDILSQAQPELLQKLSVYTNGSHFDLGTSWLELEEFWFEIHNSHKSRLLQDENRFSMHAIYQPFVLIAFVLLLWQWKEV